MNPLELRAWIDASPDVVQGPPPAGRRFYVAVLCHHDGPDCHPEDRGATVIEVYDNGRIYGFAEPLDPADVLRHVPLMVA